MRPDMQHLLVERGHVRARWVNRMAKSWGSRCRFRNDEDEQRESLLPIKWRPAFSENLSPLYRFLEAQVGRPWDKVYSEIRAHVNADSAVQYHILQHLYDRIAVKVRVHEDGSLWHQPEWGQTEHLEKSRRLHLYVCPHTGLIRRIKFRREPPVAKRPLEHIRGNGPDHCYLKIADQWYEIHWQTIDIDGVKTRVHRQKRQLGYKELRQLGLRD